MAFYERPILKNVSLSRIGGEKTRGEELQKVFEFIFRAFGTKKSSFLARWSVFANPIEGASGRGWAGFRVMAYQGVDVDLKFVRAINAKAPSPDLVIYLKASPEVAMQRIATSRPDRG